MHSTRPSRLAAACVLMALAASAQFKPKNTEWPSYNADLAGSRYRPLDQINASNFSKLEVAWRFKTDNIGNRPEYKLEGTPLMVNGVVYTTAGSRRAAIALDAATGELLWVHGEREGARGAAAPRQLSGRGLAYWSDGKDERILYVTPGYRLIALDAKTGAVVTSFGKGGAVDLKLEDDQTILPDLTTGEIGYQTAPVVAKDTIIIGAAFREGMTPKSMRNNKGYVRGFDVRTGKRLWIFHTIPKKGEFGYDTWEKGSAEYTGNTGVWTHWVWFICRWNRPLAITMAGIVPATTFLAKAWCAWISRPGSASGISSWCIMPFGTWTFLPRRCWLTSAWMEKRSRPWRSPPSKASCTSSTA